MSATKTFLNSSTAKIYYDDQLDTLFLEYVGKVKNHQEFVEINTAVLNAFKSLTTQKFVADIRKMGVISVESQQWVVGYLLPGMMKHLNGKMLHHAQFLDPKEIFSKVSAVNIKTKAADREKGFEVHQFSERDELEKYLKGI